jgi:CHAT domain-containing protein/TolA-binding protein
MVRTVYESSTVSKVARRASGFALAAAALLSSASKGAQSGRVLRQTPAAEEASTQPVPTLVDSSTVLEREIAGGQTHSYEIVLSTGQCVSLVLDHHGIDIALDLLNPDGKLVVEFDSQRRRQGEEKAEFVADSARTYRFNVRATYPLVPAGRYQIRVAEIRPATEKDHLLFEAHKLNTEADLFNKAGKYDEAVKTGTRSLEVGESALGPDDPFVAELLQKQGLRVRTIGDIAKADSLVQRAVDIDRKALGEEDPQTAQAISSQGLILISQTDYAKAAPYFQKAIEIIERTVGPDDPQVAILLLNLSVTHMKRGNYETAAADLQRGIVISEKSMGPEDQLTMRLNYNLGDIYLSSEQFDRAEALMQKILAVLEKQDGPDHPDLAYPLQNLGIIARQKKQYDRALEYLWRSEKLREKSIGARNPLTATLLVNIGNVYHDQGDYAKAMELFVRALDILESASGPYDPSTIITLSNMARTSAARNDTAHSLEYQARLDILVEKSISLNLALGSEREKLDYIHTIAGYTEKSISMSVRQAPDDERAAEGAVTAILQRKGRVLDALSGSLATLRQHLKPADRDLLDDLSSTTTELAKLSLNGPKKTSLEQYQNKFQALEQKREQLEAEVSRRSEGYYEPDGSVTLASVKAAIPDGAVLLEFSQYRIFNPKASDRSSAFGDPRYVAYVVSRDAETRWADLGTVTEIDAAVEALREALSDPKRDDTQQLARVLDEKVMRPLRSLVGPANHLLISPDGELNLFPFEALVDEQNKYLVERYAITYLTTGRDLLRMQVVRSSRSGPFVFANPLFGEPSPAVGSIASAKQATPKSATQLSLRRSVTTGADLESVYFAPLPGTALEAKSIQFFFPEATILTGAQATKGSLRQVAAPSILHIATHGFFLQDPPTAAPRKPTQAATRDTSSAQTETKLANPLLRSGLALSGANLTKGGSEDGILTSMEASSLNLWGTRLVVLSACETGVGKVKDGEGVYGLRRAFLLAGTETLLMSLWEVNDQATLEMMRAYYSGLKQGLGRGEALRQAQLAMLKRKGRQHPFYWASFIQAGEWGNLGGKR